jgi:uracil-DNA glycosylase
MTNVTFEERLSLLSQPHVQSLSAFRKRLLQALPPEAFVPNFDPLDAGIEARVLLLLETPGRVPRKTLFTSLDNPSATSKNLKSLVAESGLKRSNLLMWNLVPWDIGLETKVQPTTSAHHSVGTRALLELLALLTKLHAVVFIGTKAQVAMPTVRDGHKNLALIPCPHPSPTNINTRPEARSQIVGALCAAYQAQNDG